MEETISSNEVIVNVLDTIPPTLDKSFAKGSDALGGVSASDIMDALSVINAKLDATLKVSGVDPKTIMKGEDDAAI